MTKVSIAMATYNGARFLEEQLASFVEQTRRPDEVVICDDSSSDETVALAERFAASAPFKVIVERNPSNLGYTPNFSKAVSLCSGDVIFLSDQDDRWFENKIETAVGALQPGVEVVLNDQLVMHPDGTVGQGMLDIHRKLGFSDDFFLAGCCTAMSRAFARIAHPFPAEIPFDTWVSRLADLLGVRRLVEQPLQIYRRHGDATTNSVFAARKPSKLEVFTRHSLADGREGWRAEVARFELVEKRLAERRDLVEQMVGPTGIAEVRARIARGKESYLRRLEIVASSRLRRAPAVFSFWREGRYGAFSGWKSAVKDLVRH